MATDTNALLHIRGLSTVAPDDPITGSLVADLENATGGRRWKDGTGAGQVGRTYYEARSLGAGAAHTYDLLAAGTLEDIAGQAIDADELKALVLVCLTGAIKLTGTALNPLGCFTAASEGLNLAASGGVRTVALDLGPDGLDVTTNSKFEITETSGATTATYGLWLIVAQ